MAAAWSRQDAIPEPTNELMWIVLIGGLLITLPAVVVALFFMGNTMALPALASFAVNSLPFLFGAYLFKKSRDKHGPGEDDDHGH